MFEFSEFLRTIAGVEINEVAWSKFSVCASYTFVEVAFVSFLRCMKRSASGRDGVLKSRSEVAFDGCGRLGHVVVVT